MTPDVTRAKEFYKALLGWEIAPGENDQSGYLHIKNGETFIGGMPPSEHQPPNTPPHWSIYYLVSKCDESTAKAKQLGGKVRMDPMSIPNVGRMSVVADPQGAMFSLFEASPKA